MRVPTKRIAAGAPVRHSPEQRLLAAVLTDALTELRDLVASPRVDDPRLARLLAWFQSRDDRWPFSFESVCAYLDLESESIRARLPARAGGAAYH